MRQRVRLGELLVQAGLLTEEQLKAALREHKKSGLRLGQYLTKTNLCRESDVVELISRQLKIERYSPQQHPLSLNMAERLPLDAAQKCSAVPLQQHGHVLVVAMVDPLDIDALDTLEFITNSEVEPLICTEQEYNQLFSAIYGMFTNLDGVIESLGELHTAAASQTDAAERDVAVDELANQADLAPVIRLVNSILAQAVREGASDVHISPEKDSVQVRFRIDGKLREAPAPPRSVAPAVVSRIKILGNMDIAVTRVPQDGRFTMHLDNREINVRVSSVPTIYGENMVLRLLEMSGRDYTLDMLGMQQNDHVTIEGAIHKPYGMILSTGPTGSGKSTSLYAILKSINRPDINIITLEDPVEYRIRGIRQVQLNRKAGMTFASGLRSILRQDPDVVMVGEIRDAETAAIAVQAALTGHLVLSTLHTNDAAGAVTRLIDMGIEPFLVSSVLLASFAQRLVRRVCTNCAEPYEPLPAALAAFGLAPDTQGATYLKGRGCHHCAHTGYRGRTGVFEILPMTQMIQDLVIKRSSTQVIAESAIDAGVMRTLKQDAAMKILRGTTTVEEAATSVML
ncbi:Type II secretion system protein E [anaerobic digester metagenome]